MRTAIPAVTAFFLLSATLPSQQTTTGGAADFVTQVLLILKNYCYGCHSGNRPVGGLRLDMRSFAMRAITPGNSKDSRIIHRIEGMDGEPQMPFGMAPLGTGQIDALKTWIDRGAPWPDTLAGDEHWSYVKPVKPALPAVQDEKWVRNPIDRFVLARLEKEGLRPSPEATKETLIRRLSLDLVGLPPTPAEVDTFVRDARPDAWDRLVDRLLASDRYGERWARLWLDLARYADSNGYEKDDRRSMWPYRDWVVKALNSNMHFDQFAIEQVAGDMLPNASNDQRIATGFLRNSMFNNEGGVDPEENNWNIQLDRATTVSTVFLGSTMGCAECHDHKFDPFTQKQFYSMVAFFNNADFGKGGTPFTEPVLDLPSPEQGAKRDALNAEIKQWQSRLNDDSDTAKDRQKAWEQSILDAESKWQPLHPDRADSAGGSTLTIGADGSVLASGANPETDTYTLEAKVPLREITGIRLEALPDPSLPRGGPGRDYYGNFMVREVNIETGPSAAKLTPVAMKETAMDDNAGNSQQGPGKKFPQVWVVDVSKEENNRRQPRQMVLVPEKPITLNANGVMRIGIAQTTEGGHQGIGRFRLSVTNSVTPKRIVEVAAMLRPVLSVAPDHRTEQQATQMTARYRNQAIELAPIRNTIKDLQAQVQTLGIPTTLVMSENPAVTHPSATIRIRGSFTSKSDEVQAAIPSFFRTLPADEPQNRLTLAKWLVSRDNPLTARVTVNHIWETYFGRGLVETSEDFGTQGSPPSHPELLDWLATEFMDCGWDMKAMHRLIVTSATYRQSSKATPELIAKDPANILLSRGARFRVEAEMVRDITLSVSGLLSSKMGGASVFPYQPNGVWELPYEKDSDTWAMSSGEDRYRRGLYTFIRRAAPYPSMTVFDATSREYCTPRRSRTDTPLQALTTLNDPAFFEAAQAMARRIVKEGGADTKARIDYAFLLATSRRPRGSELDTLIAAFGVERKYFVAHLKEADSVAGKSDADLAAWTMLSRGLLNLDETFTRH
jgi:hypothetical protein